MIRVITVLLLTRWLVASPAIPADFPQPGEWPCFRRDGGLLARSPVRGRISEPRVVWKEFVGSLETELIVERGKGPRKNILPLDATLGKPEFAKALSGFKQNDSDPNNSSGNPATTVFAEVLAEEPGLEKIEFESAFTKPTVRGHWQPCIGRCFTQRAGQWVQVWQTEPIDLLFQPLPLTGDFDADGVPEIAILPFHELILLEGRTGRIKSRCRFTDTRSYGFFGVYDFDHDGHAEFLVMGDFSKHFDVLGFREGKLSVLWQRAIELDISNPEKVLRVGPRPVTDVDGDGRDEILISLFNDAGDQRWHLTACDALTGRVKYELADEQLAGVLDLDGDGASELLTIGAHGAAVPDFGAISAWSMRGSNARRLWTHSHAAWQMVDAPLPLNVKSTATLGQRTVLSRLIQGRQTLVVKERERQDLGTLREVTWIDGAFSTGLTATSHDLEAVALDGDGRLLLRSRYVPNARTAVSVAAGAQLIIGETKRLGISAGPVAVAWSGLKMPGLATVVVQGAGNEIVAFEPTSPRPSARKLRRFLGHGQSTQWPEARGPVIADLAGDGERQILFASAASDGSARLVASDLRGRELWHHDFPGIPGQPPIWNVGGIVLWQAGHFRTDVSETGKVAPRRQDVLVTIRRSMMHSEETCLLSGTDGHELWRRDRQISQRGVGGAPFAIADFDGDGLDDASSLNPSILYILQGSTGRDILARDATWENVPAKPVYWGVPAAGDFLGDGHTAIFFGGRSMTGLVRGDGSLAWWDTLDKGAPGWPAFGDFDGDGRKGSIGVGYEDGARCYDLATGRVKWRLPTPVPGSVAGCASGDLDGDGRDEALFVIGQELICLGSSGGTGSIEWRLHLPVACGPPTLAVLEPGGPLSVLLAGSDGYVYCVQ